MISFRHLKSVLQKSEQYFQICWNTLEGFRSGSIERSKLVEAIALFQATLGDGLCLAENLYVDISKEERLLIPRKRHLNPKWFSSRMQRLARFKEIIESTIDTGRSLGDAYAWLFYQKESSLLHRHTAHGPIAHSLSGVGGRAEIEFIRNAPKFGKYIVLSHSLTSFLSLGDISLIDPVKNKVVGIGELKAHREGDYLNLRVHLIFSELDQALLPVVSKVPLEKPPFALNPSATDRLKRQIKSIHKGFMEHPSLPNVDDKEQKIFGPPVFRNLEETFKATTYRFMKTIHADNAGLAFVGLKIRGKTMCNRLCGKPPSTEKSFLKALDVFKAVVDKSIPDNSLRIGWLNFPSKDRYRLPTGATPIFWWPVSRELREAMIFRKFMVMTLFNPAHFIKALRDTGIDVKVDARGNLGISKNIQGQHVIWQGCGYLLSLMQHYMIPAVAVAQSVQLSFQKMEEAKLAGGSVVLWHVDFKLG